MVVKAKMQNGNILDVRILSQEKRYGKDVYIVCKASAPTNFYRFYIDKEMILD